MKVTTPRRLALDEVQGDWEDVREDVVATINDFQDSVIATVNGGISSENTTSTHGTYLLKHNTEIRIRDPLVERGGKTVGVYAMRCVGVEIGSSGQPSRRTYELAVPRIDWIPFRDQLLITPQYDLRHTEPSATFVRTSTQSLTSGTETPIQWNSSTITGSAISLVSNSRITIAEPGWFVFTGTVGIASNAAPRLFACWRENGNAADYGNLSLAAPVGGGNNNYRHTSLQRAFSVGDYVELIAFQDSGGPINTVADYTQCQVSRTRNDSTPTGRVTLFFYGG